MENKTPQPDAEYLVNHTDITAEDFVPPAGWCLEDDDLVLDLPDFSLDWDI